MYEAFYGFREKPFNLTPDPRFLYLSAKHNEAFAHLEFGLNERGGFIVVSGEVGTGKTTLCRYFLERLDEDTVSAFILYPALGTTELLQSINRDLGIASTARTDKELIDELHEFLLSARKKNKNIVLVIDEAQNLSRDVLEQVRLISNLETDTEKLIQIVLIGQSELNVLLAQNDLRQLAQRVTARYHLAPLSRHEMTQYIRHRLAIAGGIERVEFTPAALGAIHRFSKGIPRLINLACDRALLAGYVAETHRIGRRLVRRAIGELQATDARPWYKRWWVPAASIFALVTGVVFAARPAGERFRFGSAGAVADTEGPSARGAISMLGADEIVEHFELRLLTLSEELSYRAASAVLLERWGIRLGGGVNAISPVEDMPSLAARAALQYSELETSFDQLRALNMPAVLELFHPAREKKLYVTLTRLGEREAEVYFAPGDFFSIPLEALARFWGGRARVFWRDFEALESADIPRRLAWAKARLANLGLLEGEGNAAALRDAVRTLQERVLLEPTGQLGHETRMALYSLAGSYRVPRLDVR